MRVIAGTARGVPLKTIKSMNTRPTLDRVKESVFSILQYRLEDSTVADFFSGSGSYCIESLSRGAKKAFLIERSREAVSCIRFNLKKTKLSDRAIVLPLPF